MGLQYGVGGEEGPQAEGVPAGYLLTKGATEGHKDIVLVVPGTAGGWVCCVTSVGWGKGPALSELNSDS